MGQSSNKYRQIINTNEEKNLIVADVELVIKESTVLGGNLGCFANQFIPKGTVFCKSNPCDIDNDTRFMNDLLYTGDAQKYLQIIENNNDTITNIGYVCVGDGFLSITRAYCKALKDIAIGEELSRFYGPDYWFRYEFDNAYSELLSQGKIPSVYVLHDTYSAGLMFNTRSTVFVKYVDGKYYYVKGYMEKSEAYRIKSFNDIPIFKNDKNVEEYKDIMFTEDSQKWNFKYLIDVSKKDNSQYLLNEPIDGYYSDTYWRTDEGEKYSARCIAENKTYWESADWDSTQEKYLLEPDSDSYFDTIIKPNTKIDIDVDVNPETKEMNL